MERAEGQRRRSDADSREPWWHDRMLCMLSPDCLRRQLGLDVMRRFYAIGLSAESALLVQVMPSVIDRMSELQGVGAGEVYRYRALDALFSLGPCLVVVLRDQHDRSAAERHALATRLKGDARPDRAASGTIRGDLRATNVVMSLLHVSDSPQRSAVEFDLLTGGANVASCVADPDRLVALLHGSQPLERRNFGDVLAAFRGRVIAALWEELDPATRDSAVRFGADGSLGHPGTGPLLAARAAVRTSRPKLADMLAIRFDGNPPWPDMTAVRQTFAGAGLQLDDWESTVLTTSCHFASRIDRPAAVGVPVSE